MLGFQLETGEETSMSKELRVSLDEEVHSLVMAAAKARRTSPARIVTEAIMMQFDLGPRFREAILALDAAKADGDRIRAISDFIADLYRAEADEAAEQPRAT